jgi:sugar phosphate permease
VLLRLGWKWTMIVGILGHAARFAVFAFFPDIKGLIVAIQLLHGICYAFFFVTVYIFVDAVFPKDVRSSAQGLFNLLILGIGQMIASTAFPKLVASFTAPDKTVEWHKFFLIPTGMALVGIALLALFFKPPTQAPDQTPAAEPKDPAAAAKARETCPTCGGPTRDNGTYCPKCGSLVAMP